MTFDEFKAQDQTYFNRGLRITALEIDNGRQHALSHGSLQNWDNAVRPRRPGGFTGWYFHIQPNGVIVKAGDTVQRGRPVANSGNIGRTSGPHLHFQVQDDSTNWGQSVPISFGNGEVPAGGATVTSDNANSNFP
jgi:murein DD-endopeptidase MepM/ murein hydrolase activator NlpD